MWATVTASASFTRYLSRILCISFSKLLFCALKPIPAEIQWVEKASTTSEMRESIFRVVTKHLSGSLGSGIVKIYGNGHLSRASEPPTCLGDLPCTSLLVLLVGSRVFHFVVAIPSRRAAWNLLFSLTLCSCVVGRIVDTSRLAGDPACKMFSRSHYRRHAEDKLMDSLLVFPTGRYSRNIIAGW